MSPKKREGGEAPHTPFLCHVWCLYCGQHAGARRAVLATASSSSNCTFVEIIWHCLPISFKPHHNFIHCEPWTPDTPNGKPAGLSLNMIWRWPRKKRRKKPHAYCLRVSLPLLRSTLQSISTKAFARLGEMKGGHLPSLRKAATRTRHYCEIQPLLYPAAGFAPAMVYFGDQFV